MNIAMEMPTVSKLTTGNNRYALGGFLVLSLALTTAAGAQEIFRWVDKDGKVHYGDILPPPTEVKNVETKKLSESLIEQQAVPYGVSIAMKNNPVTLYANNCGEACADAKALLAKRGILFADKNPESDPEAAAALKALVGALQVPTIAIGANSLQGFEEGSWNAALTAAGYPRFNPNLRAGAAKALPKVAPPIPAN